MTSGADVRAVLRYTESVREVDDYAAVEQMVRALPRDSVTVDYRGLPVSVKRGYLDGAVITAQPE